MKRVVFVLGPTASGKTALAMELAKKWNGAILNCDSLQIYQRLDVGSAKPSLAERESVPHLLFDIVPPGQVLTAGDYRRLALAALEESPCQLILAVGGSGFYVQALEKGLFAVPKASAKNERLVKEELEKWGAQKLWERLNREDPDSAARLNPNDSYRVGRALTVLLDTGHGMAWWKAQFKPLPFPYPKLKIGLAPARADLEKRIHRRTADMLLAGLLEETRQLLEDGFEKWPPLQSVGYKECSDVLRGRMATHHLREQIELKTLQLAKKQKTWFARDHEIVWLKDSDLVAEATRCVTRFIDET
ncbi:MAG: tRNA (adenosine(37)-N6)-dimethylallyltransferase MiaA [Bdellovibrionales bacterium]